MKNVLPYQIYVNWINNKVRIHAVSPIGNDGIELTPNHTVEDVFARFKDYTNIMIHIDSVE